MKSKDMIKTKLFKEMSSILGDVDAYKQLSTAYKSYEDYTGATGVDSDWDWDTALMEAFVFDHTSQGHHYWWGLYIKIGD
jgi:hypothetical protein